MSTYTVGDLVSHMGAELLQGDAGREVSTFSFSSKEGDGQTVFLPIVGERADAHDYIGDAYAHGMRVTLTERGELVPGTEDMCYLKVDKTADAWQRFGAWVRSEHANVPLVSITGSVGKTTTKELIATALSPLGTVLKTQGNRNGQLGVPQMMLMLTDNTDVAVIEMGMSLFGEMGRIAPVSTPNYAVITNIGVSHIGNLLSQENIRKEKLCCFNHMAAPAVVLVNGDDRLLRVLCPSCPDYRGYEDIDLYPETRAVLAKVTVLSYGTAEWCDYRYSDAVLYGEGSEFTFSCEGVKCKVSLPVPGIHNVSNATAAIAMAIRLGLAPEQAKEALAGYRPMAMRGTVERLQGGICLIDDTYNASPDSMRSGLDILEGTTGTRHIAVLADILELGEQSKACHHLVGKYVAEHCVDVLITIGAEAKEIAVGAADGTRDIHSFATRDEGQAYLLSILREGDVVLLKGSRGMGLDHIAKIIREREE